MGQNTIITGGSGSDTGAVEAALPAFDFSNDTITFDYSSMTDSITIPNGGYTLTANTSIDYTSTYGYDTSVNITGDGITMKEGCDIKVGNRSLTDTIDKIEERLSILHPNPELEERWEQLKSLRQQYMDLEKELLEKEKMWKILKEK